MSHLLYLLCLPRKRQTGMLSQGGLWPLPSELQAEKATLVEVMERSLFVPAAHVCSCRASLAAPAALSHFFPHTTHTAHGQASRAAGATAGSEPAQESVGNVGGSAAEGDRAGSQTAFPWSMCGTFSMGAPTAALPGSVLLPHPAPVQLSAARGSQKPSC